MIRAQLARVGEIRRSVLVVAACGATRRASTRRGSRDRRPPPRRGDGRARAQSEDPLAFLRDPSLFGDLVDEPRFTAPYLEALRMLHDQGARATVRARAGQ